MMQPGQRVLLLDLSACIGQCEVKAGAVSGTFEPGVETALLGLIVTELRTLARRVSAIAGVGVDQYADRPDLSVDHCNGCGHMTDHRYLRGEWICAVCGTATEPHRSLKLVDEAV